ncbi:MULTISPECIES: DUF3375 domain-containing protein [Xanthomonas]|uniref:DUF3375 domain-containing protein n=1 Tax=Xanthomonas TaxID=338 RepID=UPI001F494468|nr:DUF3375 domain-containing protein [Xanthomonas arboricola]
MHRSSVDRTQSYILARHQHPAWQLLAGRRAPLVLGCLQALFEAGQDGVDDDDAQQALATLLREHAGRSEFEIEGDVEALARKELRTWIRCALIVEREGRVYATDALELALRFVDGLENRVMTSTASRLAIVQREIERLEARLNPDPKSRVEHLRAQIAGLQRELEEAEDGRVETADAHEAAEGARELYALATSLRADFRRVEDSWRNADLRLRHAIVSERQHRGAIVDALLNGHDELLETPEGRVFQAFHQQLQQEVELEAMKHRLQAILRHPQALSALSALQQADMRWLVTRLVKEAGAVIRARSRSERDVRSFLRTNLAAEHHRVGQLLSEALAQAQRIDWQAAVRRGPSPFPPVAAPCGGLPLVDRLRFKSADHEALRELDLKRQSGNIEAIADDFWSSLDGLDRDALVRDTVAILQTSDRHLSLAALAERIPLTHDLESLALWVGMAREVGAPVGDDFEHLNLTTRDEKNLRFTVPKIELDPAAFAAFDWEP